MIISHKHKYIYVKNAKVGGSSVEQYLSLHVGPDDIVTPMGKEGLLSTHMQNLFGRKYRFQNQGGFWEHSSLFDIPQTKTPGVMKKRKLSSHGRCLLTIESRVITWRLHIWPFAARISRLPNAAQSK